MRLFSALLLLFLYSLRRFAVCSKLLADQALVSGAAVQHSTERQKRSFVQLQVDENSARAAMHCDLKFQIEIN